MMQSDKMKGSKRTAGKRKPLKASRRRGLRAAGIAGIIALVLFVPVFIMGAIGSLSESIPKSFAIPYLALSMAMLISSIIFIRGFIIIGEAVKNRFLVVMSWVALVMALFYTGYDALSIVFTSISHNAAGILLLITAGIAAILLGSAILQLKSKFRGLAKAAGMMEIISGACSLAVVLAFITVVLHIPLMIVEIMLLFRAAEEL